MQKNLNIQDQSFLSLNDSNLPHLEKISSNHVAFGEQKFCMLTIKNKVAVKNSRSKEANLKHFNTNEAFIIDVQVFNLVSHQYLTNV